MNESLQLLTHRCDCEQRKRIPRKGDNERPTIHVQFLDTVDGEHCFHFLTVRHFCLCWCMRGVAGRWVLCQLDNDRALLVVVEVDARSEEAAAFGIDDDPFHFDSVFDPRFDVVVSAH